MQERFQADIATIGLALSALGAGTIVALALAGLACRRFGSRRVVTWAAAAGCLMLAALGAVPTTTALIATLVGFGLALGAWDGAMNIQGVALERVNHRHWLTRLHGWWSLGTVVGAGLGAAAAGAGVPLTVHLGLIAVAGAGVCLVGASGFTEDAKVLSSPIGLLSDRRLARRLGMVALLILVGATIEGAAGDWLAIYLASDRGLPDAVASTAYFAFVVAIAAGRFAATRWNGIAGKVATVRWGSALAGVGIAALVLVPPTPLAMVGAVVWGLGVCVVFPAALSASGQAGSADVIALMTAVGYGAGLVGPFLIGAVASTYGLGNALLVLPVLAVILILFAGQLARGVDEPESAG